MAGMGPIQFPEHLKTHDLSEQELAAMSPAQQALAKDWRLINRKMDWVIQELVAQHNVLAEHDVLLDTFKKWLWLSSLTVGGGGTVGGLIWFLTRYGGQ